MKTSFRYVLVIVFVAALAMIVFLQFNSSRSINQLIIGNEDLMSLLKVKSALQELQQDVGQLEADVKTQVFNGVKMDSAEFTSQVHKINHRFELLDSVNHQVSMDASIDRLRQFVNYKVEGCRNMMIAVAAGNVPIAQIIADQRGELITDSIRVVSDRIDQEYQSHVTELIENADQNGRNAKTFGTILAIFAVLASVLAFGYISYKIVDQQRLIERLNTSELEAKQSVVIKEHFLANMSHEIRTPLNAVLGFANILNKQKGYAEVEKYSGLIGKAGQNLLQIVNNILDLSKIEAGMMPLEDEPFLVEETIDNITSIYKQQVAEKGLQLLVNVDAIVPEVLVGDEARLTQVIVNLLGNAIKFTNKGSVALLVTIKEKEAESVWLQITVSDTGIGMNDEELAMVFARFQQSDGSITRRYGGTGLGLAIVQDLVQLMKGTIDVKSEKDKGTSFIVALPYKIGHRAHIEKENENIASAPVLGLQRILAVEDNEMNIILLEQLLKGWGITYDIARNGRIALEFLKKSSYALILMDIQMPEMDGYSATHIIREELKLDTPIIAMTADVLSGQEEKCLAAGMNGYISKPIQESVLRKIIGNYSEIVDSENGLQAGESASGKKQYATINLDYVKAIGQGNTEYEKAVFEQFFIQVPKELKEMEALIKPGQLEPVKRLAHGMKSTLSLLIPAGVVFPLLERIESAITIQDLNKDFDELKQLCEAALEEAKDYYYHNGMA